MEAFVNGTQRITQKMGKEQRCYSDFKILLLHVFIFLWFKKAHLASNAWYTIMLSYVFAMSNIWFYKQSPPTPDRGHHSGIKSPLGTEKSTLEQSPCLLLSSSEYPNTGLVYPFTDQSGAVTPSVYFVVVVYPNGVGLNHVLYECYFWRFQITSFLFSFSRRRPLLNKSDEDFLLMSSI